MRYSIAQLDAQLGSAAESEHSFGIAAFGIFCLLIALACSTWGRVRQFIGSLVGTLMFCLSVAYLWSEMTAGPLFSLRKSEPSVLNAVLFLAFFGVPGLAYAFKARFGFRKKEPSA